MWPFKKKEEIETRSTGTGFTSQIMAARADYITGVDGVGELTATVQSCVSLWEGGLSLADVDGTDLLTPRDLALVARSLALRGECVFLIGDDGLIPCSDWDLTTRNTRPTAYRVGISEMGGAASKTVLAAEVLHFRIGCDVGMPYIGSSPLRRSRLTAGLLQTVETALSEIYANAPLGSSIIPFPEAPDTDMADIARGLRGFRGKSLVRESVAVTAAGGPAPQTDLKPHDVTPDLSKAMTKETLAGARAGIEMAFGVLPGLGNVTAQANAIRESQRQLCQWTLSPIAAMIGQECSEKMGSEIKLDCMRPLQAFDAGGRARALSAIVQTMALAKDAGVDADKALELVDWND